MKTFKKCLIAVLATVLMIPLLAGCGKTSSQVEAEARDTIEANTIEGIMGVLGNGIGNVLVNTDVDTFRSYIEGGNTYASLPFDNDLLVRWQQFTDEHGNVTDAEAVSVEKDDDNYVGHLVLTGEDSETMRLNITFNESGTPVKTTLEAYTDDTKDTFGTKMGKAGLHTAIGMLVVFTLLIVLCLIISCFQFLGNSKKEKEAKEAIQAKKSSASNAASVSPVNVQAGDDGELAAVIAAAIAASEGTSTDSFVVRSIRRLDNNKW